MNVTIKINDEATMDPSQWGASPEQITGWSAPGKDSVSEAVNGVEINYPAVIGVLIAILGTILALPHAGAFVAGFGVVARGVFQVAGVIAGAVCFIAGTYYGGRFAYRAYWEHKKNAVEFSVWKRQTELAASHGMTGERPGNAAPLVEFGNVRQVRYADALPVIDYAVNNQRQIERRTS